MGPMYAGFDPRDERCAPVYRFCQDRGLPILFHAGTTFIRVAPLGFTRPWLFDEVAIAYPELRMVLAHVGHPFGEECLVVIRKHPHVYADISALYYRPWQFYTMLIAAQEYHVTHKLLFGTDYPFAGDRTRSRVCAGRTTSSARADCRASRKRSSPTSSTGTAFPCWASGHERIP